MKRLFVALSSFCLVFTDVNSVKAQSYFTESEQLYLAQVDIYFGAAELYAFQQELRNDFGLQRMTIGTGETACLAFKSGSTPESLARFNLEMSQNDSIEERYISLQHSLAISFAAAQYLCPEYSYLLQ